MTSPGRHCYLFSLVKQACNSSAPLRTTEGKGPSREALRPSANDQSVKQHSGCWLVLSAHDSSMGRTLRRSWLAAEPAPVASTSLMAPSSSTATTTELLDDWSFSYLPASSSTVPSTTEQIRRSVLPSSSTTDQREPPWRTHATTTFGGFTSEAENGASTGIHSNNIRISRAARASWNAAFNDPSDFPASSSMLPPRLGTPVPSASTSAETLLAPLQSAIGQLGRRIQPGDLTFDEDLTSIGRRARARQDGTSESSNTGSSVSSLVHSLNLETLERAQLAVEGSRIALEEARLAIRTALRNSET